VSTPSRTHPVDPVSGLHAGARQVASPNHDERPAGCAIEVLVVHCISLPPGVFGGPEVEALFCNRLDPAAHAYFRDIAHLRVSAHFFIRRDGELVQFVPLHRRAWHAGESRCLGRARVNDFSVGVELEGTEKSTFAEAQYRTLATLTDDLVAVCPGLSADRLYGHSDIAPGRKGDPGPGFDWARYRGLLTCR